MISAEHAPPDYVAFDLETTGLSPKADRPLEIGAVRYDGQLRKLAELDLIVDPGMPIPLAVQRLTGIRPEDVRGAPTPEEGMAQLADFCRDSALVAHGGAFDMAHCRTYLPAEFSNRLVLDTLELARIVLPSTLSHSLPVLSTQLSLDHARPHRALSDATATGALLQRLAELAAVLPAETLASLRRLAGQAGGPLAHFFLAVVMGSGSAARRRPGRVPREEPPARAPADVEALPLDRAAAALLGPDGPLAARDTYEYRESQVQMTVAVAQALERGRRLLVEAGPGVGKSLAYATPLALWAARSGKRAVVATNTITLQEQLVEHDLPAVMRLLPSPVSAVMLKGRNQYISLRRWERWLGEADVGPHAPDLDAIRFKLKLLVWLAGTDTGDRSELHLTSAEEPLWRRVASDTNDCLGRDCVNWRSRRCHMVEARQSAAEASIVVTNHAVLLADSERQGQVLAPYAALVVDEAHRLEESATQHLGTSVTQLDMSIVLDRLRHVTGEPVGSALADCRDAGRRLFGDAKGFLVEQLGGQGNGTVAITSERREDPGFAPVLRSARHCAGVLLRAAEALDAAKAAHGAQQALPGEPALEELPLGSLALTELAHGIEAVAGGADPDRVAWLELRTEQAELHDAPTSVAETLRQRLFDPAEATVLTSATLAVSGSFGFVKSRLGTGDGVEELVLPSPFDFLEQALCVLAVDVPPYDDPEHDRVMGQLVQDTALRLGGGTLVLFTGYGPLKRVHSLIGAQLEPAGISVLGQGLDGTRRQILRSFLSDTRSVLLGTNSFWEGVDIPGDALRCVVIDKLPFAVPTDPLVRARTDRLADPFGQYILPQAVLRLKQGFGRLIRSRADRGAVVLCDPRLASRDYGPRFLEALPPAAVVRETAAAVAETVHAFIERGVVPEAVGQSRQWSSSDMEPA